MSEKEKYMHNQGKKLNDDAQDPAVRKKSPNHRSFRGPVERKKPSRLRFARLEEVENYALASLSKLW